jgi:hypothetical protein
VVVVGGAVFGVVGVVRTCDVGVVVGTVVGGAVLVVAFARDVVVVEPSDVMGVTANNGGEGVTAR